MKDERLSQIISGVLASGASVRLRAAGRSMEPTIRDGEPIVIAPLGERAPEAGSIVLARVAGGFRAHRVVGGGSALTIFLRGDNRLENDPPLTLDAVLGEVVGLERDGHHRPVGRESAVILLLLRIRVRFIHAARTFAAVVRDLVSRPAAA